MREGENDRGRRGTTHIYPRGCENASLIKSILGNRRCMNDGARALVRGMRPGLASGKIRAYRGITARSGVELPQYFTETFVVSPRAGGVCLRSKSLRLLPSSQLTLEISDSFRLLYSQLRGEAWSMSRERKKKRVRVFCMGKHRKLYREKDISLDFHKFG